MKIPKRNHKIPTERQHLDMEPDSWEEDYKQQDTRWKRKNRIRQLKHTIKVLTRALRDTEQCLTFTQCQTKFFLVYPDNWFAHVVLDPPHLVNVGDQSYTYAKYGRLSRDFKSDLRQIFAECFRVLRPEGTLCFKWCAEQIKLGEVLPLAEPYKPLYGQKKGKGTFWVQFIKA